MREITGELAGEEFEGTAGDASAIVDGEGMLVDLRIADKALTVNTLDLDALNADLLEAISTARQQAAERACHPGTVSRRWRAMTCSRWPKSVPTSTS